MTKNSNFLFSPQNNSEIDSREKPRSIWWHCPHTLTNYAEWKNCSYEDTAAEAEWQLWLFIVPQFVCMFVFAWHTRYHIVINHFPVRESLFVVVFYALSIDDKKYSNEFWFLILWLAFWTYGSSITLSMSVSHIHSCRINKNDMIIIWSDGGHKNENLFLINDTILPYRWGHARVDASLSQGLNDFINDDTRGSFYSTTQS